MEFEYLKDDAILELFGPEDDSVMVIPSRTEEEEKLREKIASHEVEEVVAAEVAKPDFEKRVYKQALRKVTPSANIKEQLAYTNRFMQPAGRRNAPLPRAPRLNVDKLSKFRQKMIHSMKKKAAEETKDKEIMQIVKKENEEDQLSEIHTKFRSLEDFLNLSPDELIVKKRQREIEEAGEVIEFPPEKVIKVEEEEEEIDLDDPGVFVYTPVTLYDIEKRKKKSKEEEEKKQQPLRSRLVYDLKAYYG